MSRDEEMLSLLRGIDRRLRELEGLRVPDMTIVAFAKRAGVSRSTIFNRLNSGELIKRRGRIPASELSKFVS